MRRHRIAASVLAGMLVVACTGTDDEGETEVQGLVLEREDPASGDRAPTAQAESDAKEEDDTAGEPDGANGETDDDPASGDADASARSSAPSGSSGSSGSSGADTSTASGSGSSSSGTASSGSTPTTPSQPRNDAPPAPDPQPEPEPEPAPEPEPEPEPDPTPADLADGFGRGGLTWSVQEDRWVETSSRTVEHGRPYVDASLVPVDDPEGTAETREARCAVTLHAPDDRGLRALGDLEVTLVLVNVEGEHQRLPRQILDLDVELRAGEHLEVAPPDRARTLLRDEVVRVTCEVSYARG